MRRNIQTILGIDYGEKRIGIAVGFSEGKISLPYKIIKNISKKFVLKELEKIIKEKNINLMVVGLPYSMSDRNKKSKQFKEIVNFIIFLKNNFNIKVVEQDERLSTKTAEELLLEKKKKKQKNIKDDVAASIILQAYLDKIF
ncbi:MAG: Holliday junction resolvase RuvX [Patescibacteria group bacterium]|nr:Holliday junction resolvase RuvX [Patescibacteria group bacterium]